MAPVLACVLACCSHAAGHPADQPQHANTHDTPYTPHLPLSHTLVGHARVAVFYSASTAERGARLKEWLAQGGDGWCHVELPTIHPEHLTVEWNNHTEGPDAPVRVFKASEPRSPWIVLRPPFRPQLIRADRSASAYRRGLNSAHKLANAVFHLQSIRCFAERCHPCVRSASLAVVLEDDVSFTGDSPGQCTHSDAECRSQPARAFPQLVAEAADLALLKARAANKLQLSVHGSAAWCEPASPSMASVRDDGAADAGGREQHQHPPTVAGGLLRSTAAPGGIITPPASSSSPAQRASEAEVAGWAARWAREAEVAGWAARWRDAQLQVCTNFSDSRAYVLTHEYAQQIADANRALVEHDGRGEGHCTDPWNSRTCALDPAILREFFRQCSAAATASTPVRTGHARNGTAKGAEQQPGTRASPRGCVGLALSPAKGGTKMAYALQHNKSDKFYSARAAKSVNGPAGARPKLELMFPAIAMLRDALQRRRAAKHKHTT